MKRHDPARRRLFRAAGQNASYNPTGPVGALAYRAAEAIVTRYLKSPGPLA